MLDDACLAGVYGVLLMRIPSLGSLFSSLFFVVSLLYQSNVQWKKRMYTFFNDHAQMIGIYGSVLLKVPFLTPICHHPDHKLNKDVGTQHRLLHLKGDHVQSLWDENSK
jgi:hypothetical protein